MIHNEPVSHTQVLIEHPKQHFTHSCTYVHTCICYNVVAKPIRTIRKPMFRDDRARAQTRYSIIPFIFSGPAEQLFSQNNAPTPLLSIFRPSVTWSRDHADQTAIQYTRHWDAQRRSGLGAGARSRSGKPDTAPHIIINALACLIV